MNTDTAPSQTKQAQPQSEKLLYDYFVECVTTKYFCFKGRARRKEYWSFVLFSFLIQLFLIVLSTLSAISGDNPRGIEILSRVVRIALFIPSYAVLFRRLHDVNVSGWWSLSPAIIFFSLAIFSATLHINNYQPSTSVNYSSIIFGVMGIVAIILLITLLVLTITKSNMKENKYGPVPEGVK